MALSNLRFVLTIPKYDLVDPGVKFFIIMHSSCG